MKMKSLLLTSMLTLTMLGCHKMSFVQEGVTPSATNQSSQNHINLILSLLEHSSPVEPGRTCEAVPWASIKTEKDLITWFISSLDFIIGFDFWDLQRVEIICGQE